MPINEGSKGPAILVFAMPKKPGKGVTPPTPALLKKKKGMSGLPALSGSEDMKQEMSGPDQETSRDLEETCPECAGKGCPECETESDGSSEEMDSESQHMDVIKKLIDMLSKGR